MKLTIFADNGRQGISVENDGSATSCFRVLGECY